MSKLYTMSTTTPESWPQFLDLLRKNPALFDLGGESHSIQRVIDEAAADNLFARARPDTPERADVAEDKIVGAAV